MFHQQPLETPAWQRGGVVALRVASWVVFGPITGLCVEWALQFYSRGKWVQAAAIMVFNVAAVASIPLLTAEVARHTLTGRW